MLIWIAKYQKISVWGHFMLFDSVNLLELKILKNCNFLFFYFYIQHDVLFVIPVELLAIKIYVLTHYTVKLHNFPVNLFCFLENSKQDNFFQWLSP